MTQSDLFTWSMEHDPNLRSTIVSVMILDTDPDWDRLVQTIDRGTIVVPKFRDRLITVPFELAPPRWLPDPDFDLSWHVRHFTLSGAADLSSVLDFARIEVMAAFDPARPLWQFTVLSGLNGTGSALVLKVHHSLTDGVGGIQIADEILDFLRAGTERGQVPDATSTDGGGVFGDIVRWNWSTGSGLLRSGVSAALPAVRRVVTAPARTAKDAAVLVKSLFRFARPITSTLSPLMTGRSLGRQLSVLEVPLEALRRSAHSTGCTVNDAFLAAVLIGLRDYHERNGSTVDRLRVAMPINLRQAGDPIGGNRITLARFTVPVDIAGTVDLMHALDGVVEGWKHEPAIPMSNAVAATFNRLPSGLVAQMFKHVDFVASDVPGSPIPLYIAGAQIERIYAFGPTTGTAFNVTLLSHDGTCCIGINVDTAAVPEPMTLTDCIARGLRAVTGVDDVRPTR
ncbi:wax ester/triacylglycerol synthase domain-containing protein [Nocardia sp. NPDC046473]|uniref:wax ester/triacylglycerol synthase domain-containing protein n=1 Tax=Nocardia sp. NPDC046473 TaxID=3155733 RepID=UPI0033FE6525